MNLAQNCMVRSYSGLLKKSSGAGAEGAISRGMLLNSKH